jgi:hypothetical protein
VRFLPYAACAPAPCIFPSAYTTAAFGGLCNPYFGGFGHFNLPTAGTGYLWPGFTYPFNLQPPSLYALKAGFVA